MTIDYKIRDEKLPCHINRESAKMSILSWSKIDKYEYCTGKAILLSDQSRIIEQAKFIYYPLEKALKRQTKTIEDQRRKQIDVITNQNERLAASTNRDDYKIIFEELVKERFDDTIKLINEKNPDDLIYYSISNTARKRTDDFNNAIEPFQKIKPGNMKIDEAKNCKMCLNQIQTKYQEEGINGNSKKVRYKNIKLLYKSRKAVTKFFFNSDYSSIVSHAKCKAIYGKGIPSMLARVAKVWPWGLWPFLSQNITPK